MLKKKHDGKLYLYVYMAIFWGESEVNFERILWVLPVQTRRCTHAAHALYLTVLNVLFIHLFYKLKVHLCYLFILLFINLFEEKNV